VRTAAEELARFLDRRLELTIGGRALGRRAML
jgi:hypothetical protein